MALRKCKECGQQVSTAAESCPHCGARIRRRRSGSPFLFSCLGIIVGLVLVFFLFIVFVSSIFKDVGESIRSREQEEQAILRLLKFEDVRGYQEDNYMHIEGRVRNNGSSPIDYVKIEVEWLDDQGRVLDTDWTFLVASDALRPGAAKAFDVMTPAQPAMTKYKYKVNK